MAVIKSALELALEKTKDLKVDETVEKANDAKLQGRKAASRFLEDRARSISKALASQIEPAYRQSFLNAAFEVLSSLIQLPTTAVPNAEKLDAIGKGIATLCGLSTHFASDREAKLAQQQVRSLFQQITRFLAQYENEMAQVEQAIRTQWAPKLKEKERQLSAQLGQNVRIDPMSDPEFADFYRKNIDTMRKNYSKALEDAKAQLAQMCGFEAA